MRTEDGIFNVISNQKLVMSSFYFPNFFLPPPYGYVYETF